MEFPQYMEKGSRGPAVNLVLEFLQGWGRGQGRLFKSIKGDCHYGNMGAACAMEFQRAHGGLEPDGGWGPKTRAVAKEEYGFDFEEAARHSGGTTIFVQPDGTEVAWSPEAADEVAAEHADGFR